MRPIVRNVEVMVVASLAFVLLCSSFGAAVVESVKPLPMTLDSISVTVRCEANGGVGQGSGTLVQRLIDGEVHTFVWTAAHVVDALRKVETISDANGRESIRVTFGDPMIVVEYWHGGMLVGERRLKCKVVKYSNYETGEDLALLHVRLPNAFPLSASARFMPKNFMPAIGTELCHCGSFLGQYGSNSYSTGVLSKVGRGLESCDALFDQITVVTFPGSSGGGVHRASDGRYVGMLVRGHKTQGFNLMVPVRRMHQWAIRCGMEWALDDSLPVPSLAQLDAIVVEDDAVIDGDALEEFLRTIGLSERQAVADFVILHFTIPGCSACAKMDRETFSQQSVKDLVAKSFAFTRINAATEPLLARHYGVTMFPTDIVLTRDGVELARNTGFQGAVAYIEFLKQAMEHAE
jgi:hypothetical protein